MKTSFTEYIASPRALFDIVYSSCYETNKISLNDSKTKLIMFTRRMNKFDFDLKLKLNGKKLYPTESVTYLGIKTDESLTWNEHINDTAIKLSRANATLYKVREFVNTEVLISIHNAILIAI